RPGQTSRSSSASSSGLSPERHTLVRWASADLAHPAVLVLGAAVLDVQQVVADGLRLLAGRPVGDVLHAPLGRVEADDRGDDRGGAAGERLDDVAGVQTVAQLVDGHGALDGGEAVVGREGEDGVAGD